MTEIGQYGEHAPVTLIVVDLAELGHPGALLGVIGTVIQVVGLFRSHAVPKWIPLFALLAVPTFFIPGNGWIGLITSVPMAAAATGLGYYAWRRA